MPQHFVHPLRKMLWSWLALANCFTACQTNQPALLAQDESVELTEALIIELQPRAGAGPHAITEFEATRAALLVVCRDKTKINTERVTFRNKDNEEVQHSVLAAAAMCDLNPKILQAIRELGADVNSGEKDCRPPVIDITRYAPFKAVDWLLGIEATDVNHIRIGNEKCPAAILVFNVLRNPFLKNQQKKKLVTRLVQEKGVGIIEGNFSVLKHIATDPLLKENRKIAMVRLLFAIPEVDVPDTELHYALPIYLKEKGESSEEYITSLTESFKDVIDGKGNEEIMETVLVVLVKDDIDNTRYLEALQQRNVNMNATMTSKDKNNTTYECSALGVAAVRSSTHMIETLIKLGAETDQLQRIQTEDGSHCEELSVLGLAIHESSQENADEAVKAIKTLVRLNPGLLKIPQKITQEGVKEVYSLQAFMELYDSEEGIPEKVKTTIYELLKQHGIN